MIVLIVDEDRVLIFEPKRQTPVSAHADCPVIGQRSGEPVKLPARGIHICRSSCVIQRKQLKTQPGACLGWIPAFDPVRKNFSRPRWRKLSITTYSVTIYFTIVKSHSPLVGHVLRGRGGCARPRLESREQNLTSDMDGITTY